MERHIVFRALVAALIAHRGLPYHFHDVEISEQHPVLSVSRPSLIPPSIECISVP